MLRNKLEFYPYCLHFSLINFRREGNSIFADLNLELNQAYGYDAEIYDKGDQEVIMYFNDSYKSECIERKLKNDFKNLYDGSKFW